MDIWHNVGEGSPEWTSLSLKKSDKSVPTLIDTSSEEEESFYNYIFTEELTLPSCAGHACFTVRYRTGPDAQWTWVNQKRYVKDGEIVFGPRSRVLTVPSIEAAESTTGRPPQDQLSQYLENIPSDVNVEAKESEAPNSLLWSLTGETPAAEGNESGFRTVSIGMPKEFLRYFSLVRISSAWLGPRHGKNEFKLIEDAILCSFLRSDGLSVSFLAVSGVNNVQSVFRSGEKGELVVHSRNDNTAPVQFKVLASVAEDFEVGMCALIYEARKVVSSSSVQIEPPAISDSPPESHSPTSDDVVVVQKDARAQWLADWYDGLSYCTWNGLGHDLTEEKILDALDELQRHGINIVNLIIDDNWQSIDKDGESQTQRGWRQFEANEEGFPSGLGHTAAMIRKRHPNIEHIAVWHALMGYWGGISPEGELAKKYKTRQVTKNDRLAGGPMLAIDPDDIQRSLEDFYSFLTSSGIDGVKTDVQCALDALERPEDRRRFIAAYQDAWTIASLRYFGTRAISCMSMTPQHIFHSQLPVNKPTILLRNSDDYFPNAPDSHPWHVFCNAHNALLTAHLNVLPDWDMFQTSHPYASFHAAARCVSGGPIYITDEPGSHDIDLINQITAPTTRGTTVVLRPSVVGRTIDVYSDYNEGNVLRIGTYTGYALSGSGILGLFNISPTNTSIIVPLITFPGIDPSSSIQKTNVEHSTSRRYIVRSHTTGTVSHIMKPLDPDAFVSVSLPTKGWEILTAYPLRSFTMAGSHGCHSSTLTHVAMLGLIGKMTGIAAVVNSDIYVVEGGRLKFDVNLKALGVLGVYHSDLPKKKIDDKVMVLVSGQPVPRHTVRKDADKVLAVDVHAAWKELGLNAGWSNEVRVQIFIS